MTIHLCDVSNSMAAFVEFLIYMMKEYHKYCSKVYRCRSASDLQRVVKDVF